MSGMYIDGASCGVNMLEAIDSHDIHRCEESITAFKQYIKRNLVDLSHVSQYFQGLITAFQAKELSVLAFSTFCHLIKRISIQDAHSLHDVYDIVIPFLLQRLGEPKDSIRLTAMKSLKTCVESTPNGEIDLIIHYLIKDGINKDRSEIQVPVLDFLYQIIESSANFSFSFKFILDNIIKLLNSHNQEVLGKCTQILILYFTVINPTNNTAKSDLLNAFISYNVPTNTASKVLHAIDRNIYNRYIALVNNPQGRQHTPVHQQQPNHTQNTAHTQANVTEKIQTILKKVPNWKVDDVLPKSNFSIQNDPHYETLLNDFTIQFESKESEKNWKNRQTLIIKIRQILNEELFLNNVDNFVEFIKMVKEPITKGMLSLRTTLSNNSCQLCKELALSIGSSLDSNFVEYQLNTLMKLTSARKIIQHQNSNVAVIALLLYTNFNTKFLHLFTTTIQDKNIQPRVYTGNWIHLLLLKYYDPNDLELFSYIIETCEPIIIKGLSDPIPLVKEAMRNAFWALAELEPEYENRIMRKLDNQTVKGLERSKSSYVNIQVKRTPIKQLITENLKRESAEKGESRTLMYEPVRKIQRSESLDSKRLTEDRNHMNTENKPSIRHHTLDSASHKMAIASPIVPDKVIEKEDEYEEFTGRIKRENIIYEELAADNKASQETGFKKLLEFDDSSIAMKFNHVLNNLTMVYPGLFFVVFEEPTYFGKIKGCISTENLVRIFCLYLIETQNIGRVDFVVSELPIEELCLSLISMLSYANDSSKITNINVSIQFMKHKIGIIEAILQIFTRLLLMQKSNIKSYLLNSMFESIITSYEIIEDEDNVKGMYVNVFKLCYLECEDSFVHTINEIQDIMIRREIHEILGIDFDENDGLTSNGSDTQRFLSPIKVRQDEIDEDVDQMTKIIRRVKRDDIDGDEHNPLISSDMTMLIPKRKGNGIFDFDNIELRPVDDIDVDVEDEKVREEEAVEGKKDAEMVTEDIDVIEEGTDVSMLDKERTVDEEEEEEGELGIVEDRSIVGNEEEINEIMSDSTPDLNMLTIDEIDTGAYREEEGEAEMNGGNSGYIGILKNDMLDEDSITPGEMSKLNTIGEVAYIVQHIDGYERDSLVNNMIENIRQDNFIEYCLSVIAMKGVKDEEYETLIELLNEKVGIANSVFCCVCEFVGRLPLKKVLETKKIVKLSIQMQECLLNNIYEHLKKIQIDIEDVFMIDAIAKKYVDSNEVYLRKLSYDIYKEMYLIQKGGVKDNKGVELVDEWLINSFNSKVAKYVRED